MLRRRLASASLVAGFLIGGVGFAGAAPRALLELFTSQGCSSCPPADKLLGELAKDPSLVALSLPIDIWDYLGWKDTLALPGHTARQRAYAEVRGDRQVYTPQMVVNGSVHVVGSDRAAIEQAIGRTDRNPEIMSLGVLTSMTGNELSVTVKAKPGGPPAHHGEVWLCPLARAISVVVGHGENRGHTLVYHNVVRAWRKLGEYNGGDLSYEVPLDKMGSSRVDAAAVIVQEGTRERPGIVLGTAFAPLESRATADGALSSRH